MKKSLQLEQLMTQARWISEVLGRNEPAQCSKGEPPSCVEAEGERTLTRVERGRGWSMRPFSAYDPERMCGSCRAYWFASMTVNAISDLRVSALRIEAEEPVAQGTVAS